MMPTIPLTQGQRARVDWSNYRELSQFKWCAAWNRYTKSFYARRTIVAEGMDSTEWMHRRILSLSLGDGLEADHFNHDTLDNRLSNLRIVTRRENSENRRNQSKFGPGIWKKETYRSRPFQARASVDSRTVHIGYYATAGEARQARDEFLRRSSHG
jgi:hypothetical protein